ncbi:aminoacyl-tRNA hydrolase [Candidatus Parcubacteria bacterium]|nr:MAG: aminoacyl-tRNA hydrolase [Candidatus Parcubacteria bacterium]
MQIIVGLGNPGPEYNLTRHNLGFMALDHLVSQERLKWRQRKIWQAEVCRWQNFLLVKPLTFMNNSGQSVRSILTYFRLLRYGRNLDHPTDLSSVLTVIHDDIDLPIGTYKESVGAGSGGHKGVQSIIDQLDTKQFRRFRLGIRPDNKKTPTEKFVLQKFTAKEQKIIFPLLEEIEKKIKNEI